MKKILTNKIFWGGLITLAIVGFFFFRSQTSTNGQETKIIPKKDEIIKPQVTDIKDELTLSGSIDASNKSDIRFQSAGRLAWVGVKEGDRVRKWQTLASLDKTELRKKLQQDFNTYRSALATFDDTQSEYKDEKDALVLTDEMKRILVRAQNTLDNSVINYELSDLTVKYASIFSPINGIVTTIEQPVAGVNITPATATFTVVDPASIYFKSEVEQDDISKIQVGQKAQIELDSYPDSTLDGTISYISFTPIPSRSTPTYIVHINFPVENGDLKYRIGMDGDATVALSQASGAIVIPYEALVEEDDKKYVYVKKSDSNTAQKVEVETGIETATDVEILKGISPNDQVVIKAK